MNPFTKNWLVKRISEEALRPAIEKYAKGKLIDVGCGSKPYRGLTLPRVSEHLGLELESSCHCLDSVEIIGSAYAIPVDDREFDTVLCTAVVEHLEDPAKAVREMQRVLSHGGHMIMTVPLFWHIHEEPRDFYRYTEYGIKHLMKQAGLEVVEVKPLSGYCVTFGQELVYFLWMFRKGGIINPLWWLIPLLGAMIQYLCYVLNKFDPSTSFTWMYLVIARRP